MDKVYAELANALATGGKPLLASNLPVRAQAHAERRPAAEIRR